MGGYIGSKASVVSSGAERKKHFAITATTTSLTGLTYTPTMVHVYHNGIRLVDGTDFTATDGSTITLTNAAENGDDVVVVSFATFQTSDTVSKSAGGSFANDIGIGTTSPSSRLHVKAGENNINNGLRLESEDGTQYATIDMNNAGNLRFYQNGTSRMRIDSSGNVGIGTTSPNADVEIARTVSPTLRFNNTDTTLTQGQGLGSIEFMNNDASGYGPNVGASINAVTTGTGGQNGALDFRTKSGSAEGDAASTSMYIASSGNVGIGTSSPSNKLTVSSGGMSPTARFSRNTDGTSRTVVYFYSDSNSSTVGSIGITDSSTSYNTSSDHRLKENVVNLTGATTRLKQLQPKRFNFIVDPDDTVVDGFIAHEVQTVVPEAITGTHNEVDADGNPVYQGIDQSKIVPLLTAALQEAIAKIETLETEMTSVKTRLDALEAN